MNKIKDYIFSEIGMLAINAICCGAMVLNSSAFGFIGSILWVLFLINTIQRTNLLISKILFIIYTLLALL